MSACSSASDGTTRDEQAACKGFYKQRDSTMTSMKWFLFSLVMAGSMNVAAGDADAGKAKSTTCAACHGAAGTSSIPNYPNLCGQKEAYLVKSIKAYQSGARTEPMMKPMVANLSDEDVANLAAFFSTQACK